MKQRTTKSRTCNTNNIDDVDNDDDDEDSNDEKDRERLRTHARVEGPPVSNKSHHERPEESNRPTWDDENAEALQF